MNIDINSVGGEVGKLVTERITDTAAAIREFSDIDYQYNAALSTPREPTFVCRQFGGKGLSVRLT